MNLLKSLFRLLLNLKFFIAFCAVTQCLLTYQLFVLHPNGVVLFTAFAGTGFIYNFSILTFWIRNLISGKKNAVEKNKKPEIVAICCAFILIPCGLSLRSGTLYMLLFLGCLSLFYTFPLLKLKDKWINLRELPGMKSILISFIWTMSTVWIPLYENGDFHGNWPVSQMLAGRFLFFISICIAFDIRDIVQDQKKNLYTIPIAIGEWKSRIMIVILLLTSEVILNLPGNMFSVSQQFALLISTLACITLMLYPEKKRSEFYYSFWLDGIFIFQYILVIVFSYRIN